MTFPKRSLLFVFPDYSVSNLDARTFSVLQKCKVLPVDLRMYNTIGFRADKDMFLDTIDPTRKTNPFYTSTLLVGEITTNTFLYHLQQTLTTDEPTEVLLVFCGHGHITKDRECELVLSYNEKVTQMQIEDVIKGTDFTKSFVRILNICVDEYPREGLHFSHPNGIEYKGAAVIGVNRINDMRDCLDGSAFMKAFNEVMTASKKETYASMIRLSEKFYTFHEFTDMDHFMSLKWMHEPNCETNYETLENVINLESRASNANNAIPT